jgi:hypothetical protein
MTALAYLRSLKFWPHLPALTNPCTFRATPVAQSITTQVSLVTLILYSSCTLLPSFKIRSLSGLDLATLCRCSIFCQGYMLGEQLAGKTRGKKGHGPGTSHTKPIK